VVFVRLYEKIHINEQKILSLSFNYLLPAGQPRYRGSTPRDGKRPFPFLKRRPHRLWNPPIFIFCGYRRHCHRG